MKIRRAVASDAGSVQSVIKTVYDEYGFGWDPDGYHADLYTFEESYVSCETSAFWVAEVDGAVVACCGLDFFETVPGTMGVVGEIGGTLRIGATDCEIVRLYVLSSARGLGIGKALTETVLKEARARGCAAMEIWSDKKFVEAHSLYQRYGAIIVGDRICDDPDEAPEWGLILKL